MPAAQSMSAMMRARVSRSPSTNQANSAAQIGIVYDSIATRPVVANIMAITLNSENDRTLSKPEMIRWPAFFTLPSANDRPCNPVTRNKAPAPRPNVTTRILNGGISSSATRIAGQVSPQQKLSATSINFAVVSVLYGACTRNPACAPVLSRCVGMTMPNGARPPWGAQFFFTEL